MSNKESSSLVSISLALIEAQKDISQLRRHVELLFTQLRQIDQGAAAQFKSIDEHFGKMAVQIERFKGEPHAADKERKNDSSVDEKNLRSSES